MTTPPVEPPQTTSSTPPPPTGSHTAADSRNTGDRFFSWTSGLGMVRGDGWIGGVAAGTAARLRIDPLIVRGILVVVGLFGFPVIFLYALAWALLPDLDGRIVLRDALRRRFEPAQVGILGLLILGLIPLGPGVVFVDRIPGWMLSPGLGGWSALSALLVTVGLILTVALLFIIVRAARHSARSAPPAPPQQRASAADASPDASAAATGSGPVAPVDPQGTDAAGFAASSPALSPEVVPHAPDETGAAESERPSPDDDAYAAWREQHAAWKMQDDAWRRQQQDADRAVREQARRERQERATAFAAEAAERRMLRRLSSPRTPLAFVGVALGIAVIAGTATAIAQRDALGPARGLFVAAATLGVSMVVAGVLRRRSGFLAFATVVTLIGAGAATVAPVAQSLHIGSYWLTVGDGSQPGTSASDPFVQTWGDLVIVAPDNGVDGSVYVEKTSGNTQIMAEPLEGSVRMDIEITTRDAAVDRVRLADADGRSSARLSDDPAVTSTRLADGRIRLTTTVGAADARTHHRIVIEQGSGFISVMQSSPATTTGGSR